VSLLTNFCGKVLDAANCEQLLETELVLNNFQLQRMVENGMALNVIFLI
jgi:hypothetical protein